MVVRVRVPAWATAAVTVSVNGTALASGTPGSFVALDRTWSNGDTISYSLPAAFRLTRYTGQARLAGLDRYALEYGPILMAAVGTFSPGLVDQFNQGTVRIPVAAADLVAALQPTATPLNFTVAGAPGVTFRPYWTVVQEQMSVFPVLG